MRFEVNLPERIDCWALRASGLEPEGFTKLMIAVITEKEMLPKTLKCTCTLPGTSGKASVTVFSFGSGKRSKTPTHLGVEIDDPKAAKAVRKKLEGYSFENHGEMVASREASALRDKLKKTLKREGLSEEKVLEGEARLTRRAIESLMELCRETEPVRRDNIRELFSNESVAKADRPFVLDWLLKEFQSEWLIDDQICVRLWDMATPAIADDLIRLIKDPRYGDQRWVLALALAKTKDPRAADVIVTLLGQGVNTRGALEALGKVPPQKYVPRLREFLKDPDSDVRREAKRTLKRLGAPVEKYPPPVHLVKNRRSVPKGLQETTLDMEGLDKLARCIDRGFGKQEIAEVTGVVDEMKVDQTRVFRFPVTTKAGKGEVWVEVFMDDIDDPDVAVYAAPDIIEKLDKQTPAR